MNLRFAILLLPVAALFACAAPPPAPVAVDPAALRQQLAALPGASLGAKEPLTVRYPGETLFADGAALPLPGGTAVLDPLAALLVAHPESRWTAIVRARTEVSPEYDQVLAQKRAELLRRYFRNRGLSGERLALAAEAGDGAPLELTLAVEAQPASAASSSRDKR